MSDKRVALIAGGSGGIGQAIAFRLAKTCVVWVGYHHGQDRAEEVVHRIQKEGGTAVPVPLDLRSPISSDAACEAVIREHDRLDILVNCAAINEESPAAGMDDDTWRRVLDVNLDGAFRLARAAAKPMILQRWGRIVQLSSVSAVRGGRGQINYATAKAGVEALTRVLALELGRKGVLVNGVAPGVIETDLSRRVRQDHGAAITNTVALGRFGVPEEIAGVVAFLCSEDAKFITGQVLRVDGGMGL